MATAGGVGQSMGESTSGGGIASVAGSKQSFGIIQPSLQCGGRVQLSGAAGRQVSKGPPEVINLDDDSDLPDESSDDDDGRKNGTLVAATVKNTSSSSPVSKPKEGTGGGEPVVAV